MIGLAAIAEELKKQKAEEEKNKPAIDTNDEVVGKPTLSTRTIQSIPDEKKAKKASLWDRIRGKNLDSLKEPLTVSDSNKKKSA